MVFGTPGIDLSSPAYTAVSLPDHLTVAVTLDAPDPARADDTAATTPLARYALEPLAAEAAGAPVD